MRKYQKGPSDGWRRVGEELRSSKGKNFECDDKNREINWQLWLLACVEQKGVAPLGTHQLRDDQVPGGLRATLLAAGVSRVLIGQTRANGCRSPDRGEDSRPDQRRTRTTRNDMDLGLHLHPKSPGLGQSSPTEGSTRDALCFCTNCLGECCGGTPQVSVQRSPRVLVACRSASPLNRANLVEGMDAVEKEPWNPHDGGSSRGQIQDKNPGLAPSAPAILHLEYHVVEPDVGFSA